MSGPTAEGTTSTNLSRNLHLGPPAYSQVLPFSYLRAGPRVGRGRSTPTSRICLRPSVLDRHPVLLRGVEVSNRSRVHASSPIPLYHRYLEPLLGTVGGPCSYPSSRSKGSTRTVHTPPLVWGCLCYTIQFVMHVADMKVNNRKVLLILDRYRSHMSAHTLHLFNAHRVILYALPVHTSGKTQPLDVTVFSSFKMH